MNTHISDLFFNYEPAVSAFDNDVSNACIRQAARDFSDSIYGAFLVKIDPDDLVRDFLSRI